MLGSLNIHGIQNLTVKMSRPPQHFRCVVARVTFVASGAAPTAYRSSATTTDTDNHAPRPVETTNLITGVVS
jgi:hypothetical protein